MKMCRYIGGAIASRMLVAICSMMLAVGLGAVPAWPDVPKVSDKTILQAVENKIDKDIVIPLHEIDVTVLDGVVAVKGTVENILAKERTARIAETVKGVRSVINHILVVPPFSQPDSFIKRNIQNAILINPATEKFKIQIEVKDGAVKLSGRVDSWQEKDIAETVAKSVKGVASISNLIHVVQKINRSDREIEGEVLQRLRWDARIDDSLIDVDVKSGVVFLKGKVGSVAEKRIIIIDSWISGVRSVDASGLKVTQRARDKNFKKEKYQLKTDAEIKKAIEDAFLYDVRVTPFNPKVEVENGVVTLRGRVNHLLAKRAAAQNARNTVGVYLVKNRLRVRPEEKIEDVEIARNVRGAIERGPFTELDGIRVRVVNGVVNLDGEVDTPFLKVKSENIASQIKGVVHVKNRIYVKSQGKNYSYKIYVDPWAPYDSEWYDIRQVFSYRTKNDSEIRKQIENELWWSPFVDSEDIKVSVEDGAATLTGFVDSWLEYRAATENALEGGAVRVRNKLALRTYSSGN